MRLNLLVLLTSAAPFAFADVKFTTPAPAAQLTAGSALSVGWIDSGSAPSVSDLASYQLFLCAGGNDGSSFVSSTLIRKHSLVDFAVQYNHSCSSCLPDTTGPARSGNICRKQRKDIGADTSQPRSQYNERIVSTPRPVKMSSIPYSCRISGLTAVHSVPAFLR